MKPKLHAADLFILGIILAPYLYLGYVYDRLPPMVATHFGFDGTPNDYSHRQSMWYVVSLMAAVSIFMFLLFRFMPRIDPKKTAKYSAEVFNKIAVAVVLLLSVLNCLIINAALAGGFKLRSVMPVLMGVFFAFMGNVMHSIKPNYFAGIRTPWTLESEETWRLTHQFGGKLWFIGGIVIAITGFIVPAEIETYVLMGGLAILAIVPIVYSYTCFKSPQKNKQS